MNCRIALVGVIIFSSSVPANAQWPFGGGWEQPQYQRSEPRRERRSHTSRHYSEPKRHDDPKPKPKPKPVVEYRTRTIVKSWNDLSQDKARDWIREQVQTFCGKYPKDVACQKPKEE